MSILQIIQDVCTEVGIATPVVAVTSTDPTILQMTLLAMRSGNDLQRRWTWLAMKQEVPSTFTGDGTTTLFTFPAGFWSLQDSDVFTSSVYPTIPLRGPINDDDLLQLKALPFLVTPAVWRRVLVNQVEFYPAPAAGEIISYVYGSKQWIFSALGAAQSRWLLDTDTSIISEDLITLHTIWRWKRAKGLDYSEEFRTAESAFDSEAGGENQARVINMSRTLLTDDTWWPGNIIDGTDHNF
jgi:hypothetical protein